MWDDRDDDYIAEVRSDRDDDYRQEVRNYIRCKDGFCGATDCQTCRPGNFTDGVWNEDIEEKTTIEDD
jgi:hypothetical protein